MQGVEVIEQGAIPVLSPREVLFNLGIDEKALDELIIFAGVDVDVEQLPATRIIAADILLSSIFAADLPEAVDFDAVLGLLTVTNDTAFADQHPELVTKLLALACEDRPASGAELFERRMRLARDRIFGVTVAG